MSLYEKIRRKYQKTNHIYSALFEVTHRCPCRCIHCFLSKKPQEELTLPEIASLFDQLASEGTIELTLSGGEPLLREDFFDILALAYKYNFMLDVLTTGLLLGTPEIELLKKYGVNRIELSLLGAGAATHDAIMNYPGAFEKLKKVVPLLKDAGLLVALKTTVIKPNWNELDAMAGLAGSWGVRYSASLSLVPCEDKDPRIWSLFLSPEDFSGVNMSLLEGAGISTEEGIAGFSRLVCQAGLTTVCISPSGEIYPCVLLRERAGNIREQRLQEIWHTSAVKILRQLRALKEADIKECVACIYKSTCPRCPGIAYQETGQLATRSPSACQLARVQSFR